MSPAAAPGASFAEEIRDLGERLRAAAEKCGQLSEESGQLSEENLALHARLAAAQEQLAAAKAENGHLLKENRNLSERLAKANSELVFFSDSGVDSGVSTRQTTDSSSSAQDSEGLATESSDPHEAVTMALALSATPTQTTLPIGVLFPDAGHDYGKMMSGVKDIPAVQDMLEKAQAIMGFDVLELSLESWEKERAERAALAYISVLAGLEKLRREREEAVTCAQVMAGLGVGEYAALVAAGVFSFEDGLKLVRLRLEAITEATGVKQATAWVAGLDRPTLAALCARVRKKARGGVVCQISARCFPRGYSVAGTENSVMALTKLAEQAGGWALQVDSHAVHSPLMGHAQSRMNVMLDDVLPKMNPPRTAVYMNAAAAPVRPGTDPKEVAAILKRELVRPLLWETSVQAMIEEGVSEFYEVGHGEVLKGFMKRINRKAWRTTTSVIV